MNHGTFLPLAGALIASLWCTEIQPPWRQTNVDAPGLTRREVMRAYLAGEIVVRKCLSAQFDIPMAS
ncbi:MAG: hypothetical protein FWD80_04795 [Propionibacteriaceae bacterium]|nr:hypothetical protein [Propionibacteriaceae bacterium]